MYWLQSGLFRWFGADVPKLQRLKVTLRVHEATTKVKYTWIICIARLRTNASNTLRYGSHSVICKQHHICNDLKWHSGYVKQLVQWSLGQVNGMQYNIKLVTRHM